MTTRTYLFALVDGGGTVPPELGTVRRLVERGHRVTVLAEDSMADDVRATGAAYRPWVEAPNRASRRPEDDPYRDWECKNPIAAVRPAARQAVRRARRPATPPTCSPPSPTTVPTSSCARSSPSAPWSAPRRPGCPSTSCSPTPTCSRRRACRRSGSGLQPAPARSVGLRDRAVTAFTDRLWDKGLPRLNDLRADHGLAPLASFFDQIHAARRVLVLTSADFDFPAELPANVRYVGAVLDDPDVGAARRGPRLPATTRSCSSRCRRRSRTRRAASSASSTPSARCPSGASSPPVRPSTRRR